MPRRVETGGRPTHLLEPEYLSERPEPPVFNPSGSGVLNAKRTTTVTKLANGVTASSGGGGGKSGCFIATAAFGTPLAAEVMELRHFRDGYLLKRGWGQSFVKFYYARSPPIADFIRDRARLRAIVRVALRPLIWLAEWVNAAEVPTTPAGSLQAPQLTAMLPTRRELRA